MSDVMDFINGGGTKTPSATFKAVGDAVVGTILDFAVQQSRDFKTNDPEWWDDAKTEPKRQLVITLQTEERDASIADDDGRRRVFAKKPGNLLQAISDALAASGSKIAEGGRLAVRFTGEKPHENPRFSAIKEYAAAYEPPAVTAADDLLNGNNGTPAQAEPVAATNVADLL
jgi:hypothetical protein